MSAFNAITRQTSRVCCQATSIQSLAFVWQVLCPAGTGAFLFMLFWTPTRRAARGAYMAFASERIKPSLPFERGGLCPAGTGLFFLCCFGRLRRGQGGAGYGAAPPSRPPLHPPRSTPLGLSRFRHSTRAARLLLRELPRCARRSPCAPRNASVRFRVDRGVVRSSH